MTALDQFKCQVLTGWSSCHHFSGKGKTSLAASVLNSKVLVCSKTRIPKHWIICSQNTWSFSMAIFPHNGQWLCGFAFGGANWPSFTRTLVWTAIPCLHNLHFLAGFACQFGCSSLTNSKRTEIVRFNSRLIWRERQKKKLKKECQGITKTQLRYLKTDIQYFSKRCPRK